MTVESIEDLVKLLNTQGGVAYFGEPVSILEHSLQAAHSAEVAGGNPAIISAALLHDVGHMLHGFDEGIAGRGYDGMHEEVAAAYLARWFREDVTEPIHLHVPAKRFLCWRERDYLAQLSPASIQSLALQGGPMNDEQAAAFLRHPFAEAAIALRRWDDEAKCLDSKFPKLRTTSKSCTLRRKPPAENCSRDVCHGPADFEAKRRASSAGASKKLREPRKGAPHISPAVGEMWEVTKACVELSKVSTPTSVNSHVSPTAGEIWGTLFGALDS